MSVLATVAPLRPVAVAGVTHQGFELMAKAQGDQPPGHMFVFG